MLERFSRRSSPSLLYQAPRPVLLIVGSWALGGFCIAWAALNFSNDFMDPPESLHPILVRGIGVTCVFMTLFGLYVISRVSRAGWALERRYWR